MEAVTAFSMNRGPGSFSIHPTITLQETYQYLGALLFTPYLTPWSSSGYICNSDYIAQAQHETRSVRELHAHLMQRRTEMLLEGMLTFKRLEAFENGC